MTALWTSRALYFTNGRTGWGDATADGEQHFLWWVTLISAASLILLIIFTSVRSVGFRWAVLGGGMLSGVLLWLSRFQGLEHVAFLLLPGLFAGILAFGIHADFSQWTTLLWTFGINTAFYAVVIRLALLGLSARSAERGVSHSKQLGARS